MAIAMAGCNVKPSGSNLKKDFVTPPDQVKPWTYWFFYNDFLSMEGIDQDLEAMKKAGIGTALLFGSVYLEGLTGDVSAMSDEWWELLQYAIRRAGVEGIDIGLFNGLGWRSRYSI